MDRLLAKPRAQDQNEEKTQPAKKNGYLKESQPDESHKFPLNNGGDLTEQKLPGITELGTFMVYCKFPQP